MTYKGVGRDISGFGIGAVVSAPLDIGEEIWVRYDHPSAGLTAQSVVRRAIVRQRHGYRYGFEFLHPVDERLSVALGRETPGTA